MQLEQNMERKLRSIGFKVRLREEGHCMQHVGLGSQNQRVEPSSQYDYCPKSKDKRITS